MWSLAWCICSVKLQIPAGWFHSLLMEGHLCPCPCGPTANSGWVTHLIPLGDLDWRPHIEGLAGSRSFLGTVRRLSRSCPFLYLTRKLGSTLTLHKSSLRPGELHRPCMPLAWISTGCASPSQPLVKVGPVAPAHLSGVYCPQQLVAREHPNATQHYHFSSACNSSKIPFCIPLFFLQPPRTFALGLFEAFGRRRVWGANTQLPQLWTKWKITECVCKGLNLQLQENKSSSLTRLI